VVELVRTNDLVLISWLEATLAARGIGCAVLDGHTSVLEGSIGALPRRVMVAAADLAAARRVLDDGERLAAGRAP
jgi:hypothetical protein